MDSAQNSDNLMPQNPSASLNPPTENPDNSSQNPLSSQISQNQTASQSPQSPSYVTQEVNSTSEKPQEAYAVQELSAPQEYLQDTPPTQAPEQAPQESYQPPQYPIENSVIPAQSDTQITPKPRFKFLLLFLIFFLLLLITGISGGAYLVAYEKVRLDKYPDLQKTVSNFVISLPFMPKTPKFLLAKSALVHQDVTKESFDISVAIDSKDLASALGLSGFDAAAKGEIDYSDPKNVRLNLDASFTKDFNFELRKNDNMLYFKINKLPQILFTVLGFKSSDFDSVLEKWVYYDTTPLDTEARKSMTDKEVDPLSEEFIDETFSKYIDEKVLSKMKMEKISDEGVNLYKLTLDADSELIDYFGEKMEEASKKRSGASLQDLKSEPQKLSSMVKSLRIEIYIDEKSYYTRKLIVNTDIEYDELENLYSIVPTQAISPVKEKSTAKVAFAAKFGNFGKEVEIEIPQESISLEEFMNMISEIVKKAYGSFFTSMNDQSALARSTAQDARIKTDLQIIRSALEMHRSDCGIYPQTLTFLIDEEIECSSGPYLQQIPLDPEGSEYFYKVSATGNEYSLCARLDNPLPQDPKTACPNPTYNYHLQNP